MDGRISRQANTVITFYNQLLREMQAQVAENEELQREVMRLQARQNVRNVPRDQIGMVPCSATPLDPPPTPPPSTSPSPAQVGGQGTPDPGWVWVEGQHQKHPPFVTAAPQSSDVGLEKSATFQNPPWDPAVDKGSHATLPQASAATAGMLTVPRERSLPLMGYSTEDSSIHRLTTALDCFASSGQTDAPSLPQISVSSVHTTFPLRYSEMQGSGSLPPSPSSSSQGWQQLLGEVAFQLDRRILAYIFPHRTHFYGFTLTNIFEKIVEMAMGSLSDGFEEQRGLAPARRFLELMGRLQSLGYSPNAHAGLSESLVNAYWLLPEPLRLEERGGPALLQPLLRDSLPPDLRHDAGVLLECLLQMAREDGMPIFLW